MGQEEPQSFKLAPAARSLDFYEVKAEDAIPDSARELLTSYARIPANEVNDHVDAIRKKAFSIAPYPCIGMYRFLDLGLCKSPVYQEVLQRIMNGEQFLDLGCCFGQETRQLINDGAPAENLHGSDLVQAFIDLGYDLFGDRNGEGKKISWHVANIFDDTDPAWEDLRGRLSIVYTGSFFHLFDWDEQVAVAKRIVTLLKPEPDVLLVGRQIGSISAGEFERAQGGDNKRRYRHNPQSWKELWEKVGEATGTKWDVQAEFDPKGVGLGEGRAKLNELGVGEEARRLRFVVRRV